MIIVTGDIHGEIDIHKLAGKNKTKFLGMTKEDHLIICGDFGLVWDNSSSELFWREWLEQKPFTTLFIDGNHENFDMLNEFPVEERYGGKVHRISDSIFHLMRGQVFEIEGKTFFAMGGAESHDKQYRKAGVSWWEQELPNAEEYARAYESLEKCGYKTDYVLTHCAPTNVQKELILRTSDPSYSQNRLTDFLEEINSGLDYQKWYCGHYHIDKVTLTEPRLRVLFDDLVGLS